MPPRLLVTAGPTAEDIDAVRFLVNRSSGRAGAAVARAGVERGWPTTLVLGPVALTPPAGCSVVGVRSAADMLAAVLEGLNRHDILVMAAAVADYTPAEPAAGKLKKTPGDLCLRLKRTEDILARVAAHPRRRRMAVIGFSLDRDMNEEEGWRKLRDKNLDGIVVNTVASFGADTIRARLLWRDGSSEDADGWDKDRLARALLDRGGAILSGLFGLDGDDGLA